MSNPADDEEFKSTKDVKPPKAVKKVVKHRRPSIIDSTNSAYSYPYEENMYEGGLNDRLYGAGVNERLYYSRFNRFHSF